MASKRSPGVTRRHVLRSLGAAGAVVPFSSLEHHPLVPLPQGERWSPRFLDDASVETLLALAEQIVPETDTPGARGAMVHQYIDYVVAEGEPSRRRALLDALAWFDDRARSRFGEGYADLGATEQHRLLTEAGDERSPGRDHFALVKELTIEGYYRSEVGMVQELGYEGKMYLSSFDGCRHPEHHAFEPVRCDGEKGDA